MLNTSSSTLAELARAYPAGTAVLHQHGLDFCCGGKQTLADACKVKGISDTAILQLLERSNNEVRNTPLRVELWDAPLLVRYIQHNHHAYVRGLIPTLLQQTNKVISKHGSRFPEMTVIGSEISELAQILEQHMREEESGVFLQVISGGSLNDSTSTVQDYHADHEDVGRRMELLRQLTNNFTPPVEACNTHRSVYGMLERLVSDTMQHVFLEETVLFPMIPS